MDFSLSPVEEKFRDEFADFFKREMAQAPPDWIGGNVEDTYLSDENWAFHVKMARKLGEKGWLMMALPEKYGGLNASPIVQMIFNETAGYYRAPGVDVFGVKMIGPVIHTMGNDVRHNDTSLRGCTTDWADYHAMEAIEAYYTCKIISRSAAGTTLITRVRVLRPI